MLFVFKDLVSSEEVAAKIQEFKHRNLVEKISGVVISNITNIDNAIAIIAALKNCEHVEVVQISHVVPEVGTAIVDAIAMVESITAVSILNVTRKAGVAILNKLNEIDCITEIFLQSQSRTVMREAAQLFSYRGYGQLQINDQVIVNGEVFVEDQAQLDFNKAVSEKLTMWLKNNQDRSAEPALPVVHKPVLKQPLSPPPFDRSKITSLDTMERCSTYLRVQ